MFLAFQHLNLLLCVRNLKWQSPPATTEPELNQGLACLANMLALDLDSLDWMHSPPILHQELVTKEEGTS